MAECILLKSGSSVDSGDCTATKDKVLVGCTAITEDSDDEPIEGTMPNRGVWTATVPMNGSVTVPQGHHNGIGKVNGPVITDRGAWGANIGINGRATIPQGYHSGGGSVGQSIPVQGTDVAGTDRALATNISAWSGTMCSGVRNGHYLNGVNWIQANVPNLTAGNIKKGVNIAGLIGTWEGYVAGNGDIYNRGVHGIGGGLMVRSNVSTNATLTEELTYITVSTYYDTAISTNQKINVTPYTRLNLIIEHATSGTGGRVYGCLRTSLPTSSDADYPINGTTILLKETMGNVNNFGDQSTIISCDISKIDNNCYVGFVYSNPYTGTGTKQLKINKFWLS